MNLQIIIRNLEYKNANPPFIRHIPEGLVVSYTIKEDIYKKTQTEVFTKSYRYDYTISNNTICNVAYFIINSTTWIGEMNDTDWG